MNIDFYPLYIVLARKGFSLVMTHEWLKNSEKITFDKRFEKPAKNFVR